MSGNKYLLDTNTVIALLQGNTNLGKIIDNAEWIGISIISYLEFLAFPDLPKKDRDLFESFIARIDVIDLDYENKDLMDSIISIRQGKQIKLPDAIIVASALENSATLITADKQLLNIDGIDVEDYSG